jgi:hypothetical protein
VPRVCDAVVVAIATHMPQLRSLYLRDEVNSSCGRFPDDNTREGVPDLSNTGLESLSQHLPGLLRLSLIRGSPWTHHGVFDGINDVGFMTAFSALTSLQYLKLSGFVKVGRALLLLLLLLLLLHCVCSLSSAFAVAVVLAQMTGASLEVLSQSCTQLRGLHVQGAHLAPRINLSPLPVLEVRRMHACCIAASMCTSCDAVT